LNREYESPELSADIKTALLHDSSSTYFKIVSINRNEEIKNPTHVKTRIYMTRMMIIAMGRFQNLPCHNELRFRCPLAKKDCMKIVNAITEMKMLEKKGRNPEPGSCAAPMPRVTDPYIPISPVASQKSPLTPSAFMLSPRD
jgi:hypothetical protein